MYVSNYFQRGTYVDLKVTPSQHYSVRGFDTIYCRRKHLFLLFLHFISLSKLITANADGPKIFSKKWGYVYLTEFVYNKFKLSFQMYRASRVYKILSVSYPALQCLLRKEKCIKFLMEKTEWKIKHRKHMFLFYLTYWLLISGFHCAFF